MTTEFDSQEFQGETVLITGGAGGLGVAMAQAFHQRGARIALADWDADGLQAALAQLGGEGDRAAVFTVDLRQEAEILALPESVKDRFGTVDVVINNAGVRDIAPMHEISPEAWRRTLDIDLTAPFLLSQAVIPGMLEQGGGRIINISSMTGQMAFRNRAAYCVAKAGVTMLTKVIALEYGSRGIRCNGVAPSIIETPITKFYFEDLEAPSIKSILAANPMERWGQPHEVAEPVVFLAGRGADFINGETIAVDGGWTAGYANVRLSPND